ncbi:MAG: GHMP kinase [Flavobacterium sp.]|nr:MAG: GHMP kinase [Flavobacterium sp.]
MKQEFYSNGKLLITGEYTVLDGAHALALPTKFGQSLEVKAIGGDKILWTSFDNDGTVWFDEELAVADVLNGILYSDKPETNTLIRILHEASLLNPEFLKPDSGFKVATHLTFPRKWGLGTSSTLINNIAGWFSINAFTLLKNSFGGSGYDIACAQNDTPILYSLEDGFSKVSPVDFNPAFAEKLYFVYLNKKQNSRDAIAAYRNRQNNIAPTVEKISSITSQLIKTESLSSFCEFLEMHETLMSEILGQPTVKTALFPDFKGTLKSLGAWGGDFILAAAEENPTDYFKELGYDTAIPYNEMILK